jgi:hypothetical protein
MLGLDKCAKWQLPQTYGRSCNGVKRVSVTVGKEEQVAMVRIFGKTSFMFNIETFFTPTLRIFGNLVKSFDAIGR